MSLVNLFVAGRAALANWRERRRAFDQLTALDDRSLADIGIHRSQIPAIVEGLHEFVHLDIAPTGGHTGEFAPSHNRLATGHR